MDTNCTNYPNFLFFFQFVSFVQFVLPPQYKRLFFDRNMDFKVIIGFFCRRSVGISNAFDERTEAIRSFQFVACLVHIVFRIAVVNPLW